MQTRVYNYSFLLFDREIEENISTDPVARASENERFDRYFSCCSIYYLGKYAICQKYALPLLITMDIRPSKV